MSSSRVGYGLRQVHLTPELMELLLVSDQTIQTDLPSDARLTSLHHHPDRNVFVLVFESKEWDELEEGGEIPLITPEVEPND